MSNVTTQIKPLLKWVGSKYNQPEIYTRVQELFEPYRDTHKWVEPFCGGLGMTYRVNPYMAILNDSNFHLTKFHREILTGYVWDTRVRLFTYEQLKQYPSNPTAFYLINKCCFNGLYRVNSQGKFNTPGNGKNPRDIQLPDLVPYRNKYWRIFNCDYVELPIMGDEFLYIDPPYFGTFTGYTSNGFNFSKQVQLLNYLRTLKNPIVISNSAHPMLIGLYEKMGIQYQILDTRQSMNRESMKETLATINI